MSAQESSTSALQASKPDDSEAPETKKMRLSSESKENRRILDSSDSEVPTSKESGHVGESEPRVRASDIYNYDTFICPFEGEEAGALEGSLKLEPKKMGLPMVMEHYFNTYRLYLNPIGIDGQAKEDGHPQLPKHLAHFLNNPQLYLKDPLLVTQLDDVIAKHANLPGNAPVE